MKGHKNFTILLTLLLLFLPSCSKTAEKESLTTYIPDPEKTLTIYTSHKENVYIPVIREFEQITGIWVNTVTGGTNQLLSRIKSEKRSPVADVMFGGGVESLTSYKDCFMPYKITKPLHIDPYYLSKDNSWTPFSSLPIVIVYNPKLVKQSDLNGWADLLNEEFKGEIAIADPNLSASSFTAITTIILALQESNQDILHDFIKILDNKLFNNSKEIVPAVARGDYLIGITLEEAALKAIKEEENIGIIYPEEGTSCIPDGTAIIKDCSHPENAKLFVDFTVNYQTQKLLGKAINRRSVRADISPEEGIVPLRNIPLINYDIEWACSHRNQILSKWNKYMGEN